MGNVIHKVYFDANADRPQVLSTFGGKIVYAEVANKLYPDAGFDLYFEVSKAKHISGEDEKQTFVGVSVGREAPKDYKHAITVASSEGTLYHIFQEDLVLKRTMAAMREMIRSEGERAKFYADIFAGTLEKKLPASPPSYDILVRKKHGEYTLHDVSFDGMVDLLGNLTEMSDLMRNSFVESIKKNGRGETVRHSVNGQLYSLIITRKGASA